MIFMTIYTKMKNFIEELYKRYELTNKQIDFIESQIKTWK